MANANNNGALNNSAFGDIGMIRDILMGQQISEYEQRFREMEESFARQENIFNEQIHTMRQQNEERLIAMEHDVAQKFDRLEKLLKENVQDIKNSMAANSSGDKQALGSLLAEMGKKLAGA